MKISYGVYTEILNEITTIPYMSEKLSHFLNTYYQLSTREVSDEDTTFQDSRYLLFFLIGMNCLNILIFCC